MEPSSVTVVKDLIDFALRGFNIYLIYWIFKSNFSERRDERVRDTKRDSIKFTIQELIIKPNTAELFAFFEPEFWNTDQLNNTKKKQQVGHDKVIEASQDLVKNFKSKMDLIKQRIVFPLVSVSEDFRELATIMEDAEDNFTEHVQKCVLGNQAEDETSFTKSKIEELRGKFIGILINAHASSLGISELCKSPLTK